jgi:hypothetical protein
MTKTNALLAGLTAGMLFPLTLIADDAAAAAADPQAAPATEQVAAEPAAALTVDATDPGGDETADPAMRFESPDAAAMALIDAAAAEGSDDLRAVLGSALDDLVSGDPVADAQDRQDFVELASKAADLEDETDDSAILVLGPEDWPFPIPLARDEDGWYFDTEAGVEEILDRRIGLNELYAIATARAFVEAEREYAAADPDGDGIHAYADRFWSSEGQKNGLFWPTAEGQPQSPMGPLVADAVAEGYGQREAGEGPNPYHGYYFKILTAQGPSAPGGAKSYLEDGRLTKGFGLLAWPATYGNSGIMTFQVDKRGMVYESDLGEDTAAAAISIDTFDLDEEWEPVVD